MWLAILITVVAAAGNNIGKVLQKQATKTLPKFSVKRQVLLQYLSSKTWVAGVAADISGALLMIVAFALAPVSVVQPVSAVGLIILMVFSHFYLHEKLKPHEWAAAAVAFLGILGLGLSSGEPAAQAAAPSVPPAAPAAPGAQAADLGAAAAAAAAGAAQDTPGALHMLLAFGAMLVLLAAEVAWRQQHYRRKLARQQPGGGISAELLETDALLSGLEAGACFGFSAGACKTGFLLASRASWVFAPAGLVGSVMLTSSGFVLQTRGFKAGSSIMVCTAAAVASMVSGVLVGLLALGERLPGSWHLQLARLVSWGLILAGMLCLAAGASGTNTAVKRLLRASLPADGSKRWRYIPRVLAAPLRRLSKSLHGDLEGGGDGEGPDGAGSRGELPVVGSARV